MIRLDDALSKLSKVKRTGESYVALCPAHEDKKQSLSVTEKDGKLLMKCFAGCSFEDIVTTLDNSVVAQTSKENAPVTPEKVVAVYDYTDESGETLYQVHRTNHKNFWQKKPNGENIGDTRRVLFRLPEVIKADTIFIAEGEKDVITMNVLGFTATTVSGGANTANWKPDFAGYFKDKRVILLPDNDKPGLKFMLYVAEQLLQITDKVKLIELPELESKQDITDWIQSGHTKQELLQLVADTENLQLPRVSEMGEKEDLEVEKKIFTTRELLDKYENLPPVEYLPLLGVNGLIVKGWSHLIAGEAKAGKTELLIDFCSRTEERVLFITEEAPKPWVKKLKDRGNMDIPNVKVYFALGVPFEKVIEEIKHSDATVFMVDTTRQLLRLENENDNSEISRRITDITSVVTHKLEKTLILTHHTNKKIGVSVGHDIAGGSAFTGAVDVWMTVRRPKNEPEGSRKREISGRGRDNGDITPVMYEMDSDFVFTVLGESYAFIRRNVKERVANVLTAEWKTVGSIRELLEPMPAYETVRTALTDLANEGQAMRNPDVREVNISGKTAYYKIYNNSIDGQPNMNLQQPPSLANESTSKSQYPIGFGGLEVEAVSVKSHLISKVSKEMNLQEPPDIACMHVWGEPIDDYRMCARCGQAEEVSSQDSQKQSNCILGTI